MYGLMNMSFFEGEAPSDAFRTKFSKMAINRSTSSSFYSLLVDENAIRAIDLDQREVDEAGHYLINGKGS